MDIKKIFSRILKKEKKTHRLPDIKGEIIGMSSKGDRIRISTPEKKFSVRETKKPNIYQDTKGNLYFISPHEYFSSKRKNKHT